MNIIEIWKDVPNYEGYYQVSNYGNVKSLERKVTSKNSFRIVPARNVTLNIDSNGRQTVHLWKNNKVKTYRTYQLVMFAFVGPKPIKQQVCHNDGNILNNYLLNLRYDTCKNNIADKKVHGTYKCGELCYNSAVSDNDVVNIKILIKENTFSSKEIAQKFNISIALVRSIKNEKTRAHIKI